MPRYTTWGGIPSAFYSNQTRKRKSKVGARARRRLKMKGRFNGKRDSRSSG